MNNRNLIVELEFTKTALTQKENMTKGDWDVKILFSGLKILLSLS